MSIGSEVKIVGSSFDFGVSEEGGAIFLNGLSTLSIYKSTFTNNYSKGNGGAISISGSKDVTVESSTFTNNNAS